MFDRLEYRINRLYSRIYRLYDKWRFEKPAWAALHREGGQVAVNGMKNGFLEAEKYQHRDDWSLSFDSILLVATLIIRQHIKRVVEFGAGYSTIALTHFCSQLDLDVHWDSFEHQDIFGKKLQNYLPVDERYRLHLVPLMQVTDLDFTDFFSVKDPVKHYSSVIKPVPIERISETRIKNAFYGFDFQYFLPCSVDFVILDGPNGNGRSMAYPLLRHAIKIPCWWLIDDYTHYPFLNDLAKVFNFETVNQVKTPRKQYSLLKVIKAVTER